MDVFGSRTMNTCVFTFVPNFLVWFFFLSCRWREYHKVCFHFSCSRFSRLLSTEIYHSSRTWTHHIFMSSLLNLLAMYWFFGSACGEGMFTCIPVFQAYVLPGFCNVDYFLQGVWRWSQKLIQLNRQAWLTSRKNRPYHAELQLSQKSQNYYWHFV